MKNIIFLDIDDVLVATFPQTQPYEISKDRYSKFNEYCLTNFKRLRFLLAGLFFFLFTGCGGTFHDGNEFLEATSREWLPIVEQVNYKNSEGERITFTLMDSARTLENQLYETEPGILFGISKYYIDTEQIVETYQNEDIQIKYELSMDMSNAGKTEFLKVWILDYVTNDFYEISATTWPSHTNEFTLVDSVVIGETIFYEVGELTYNERRYYFKKHQGLLSIEIAEELWVLEE